MMPAKRGVMGEGVRWSNDADAVIRGDLTAAAAYLTPRNVADTYAAEMSQHEAEVLQMLGAHLVECADCRQAAHISVRTMESHVSSLLRKFGVTDRRELAELAQTVLALDAGKPAAPVVLPRGPGRSGTPPGPHLVYASAFPRSGNRA